MLRVAIALMLTLTLPVGPSFGEVAPGRPGMMRVGLDIPTGPAAFGTDSAVLTHRYFPLAAGESIAWSGFGDWSGDLRLLTATSVELVDGVQCLHVLDEDYSSDWWVDAEGVIQFEYPYILSEYWLAQDVDGNIWLLRMIDDDGVDTVFGAADPRPELWNDLTVGDSWVSSGGWEGEVLSLNSVVGPLRTGAGPFQGCLQIWHVHTDGTNSNSSYAPGVGLVRQVYTGSGATYGYYRVPARSPDPGFGTVEFSSDSYGAVEEAGTFPVSLVRFGGSTSIVAVEFAVTGWTRSELPGFADALDWPDWMVVYMAPGQTAAVIDVLIRDNPDWSHFHTLDIALGNPVGVELGSRVTAQVVVEEAEEGTDAGTFIGPCFLDTLRLR